MEVTQWLKVFRGFIASQHRLMVISFEGKTWFMNVLY